ncbi:MAG: hypothetical protein AAFV85_28380, partial [Cyanobacteria bacterium J06634_6]
GVIAPVLSRQVYRIRTHKITKKTIRLAIVNSAPIIAVILTTSALFSSLFDLLPSLLVITPTHP